MVATHCLKIGTISGKSFVGECDLAESGSLFQIPDRGVTERGCLNVSSQLIRVTLASTFDIDLKLVDSKVQLAQIQAHRGCMKRLVKPGSIYYYKR